MEWKEIGNENPALAVGPNVTVSDEFSDGKEEEEEEDECHARRARARRQSDRSEAEQSESFVPSVPPSAKPKVNFENAKRAGVIQ